MSPEGGEEKTSVALASRSSHSREMTAGLLWAKQGWEVQTWTNLPTLAQPVPEPLRISGL